MLKIPAHFFDGSFEGGEIFPIGNEQYRCRARIPARAASQSSSLPKKSAAAEQEQHECGRPDAPLFQGFLECQAFFCTPGAGSPCRQRCASAPAQKLPEPSSRRVWPSPASPGRRAAPSRRGCTLLPPHPADPWSSGQGARCHASRHPLSACRLPFRIRALRAGRLPFSFRATPFLPCFRFCTLLLNLWIPISASGFDGREEEHPHQHEHR